MSKIIGYASPRPWEVKPSKLNTTDFTVRSGGDCLVSTSAGVLPGPQNKANAEYIAKCVNLHDEFVGLLTEMLNGGTPYVAEINALLAKAEVDIE